MRNMWKKIALLTIVGSIVTGALLAGCGSGDTDDSNTPGNTPAKPADADNGS